MDELGTLTMSAKERNRLELLGRVMERRLTQAQAAEQLGLGVRYRNSTSTSSAPIRRRPRDVWSLHI